MKKDLAYYLALPFVPHRGTGGFAVRIEELRGCITLEQAHEMIQEASSLWLETALKQGDPIPEPGEEASGKFVVRVPKGAHAALVQAKADTPVTPRRLAKMGKPPPCVRVPREAHR